MTEEQQPFKSVSKIVDLPQLLSEAGLARAEREFRRCKAYHSGCGHGMQDDGEVEPHGLNGTTLVEEIGPLLIAEIRRLRAACPACEGLGQITEDHGDMSAVCASCKGSGQRRQ